MLPRVMRFARGQSRTARTNALRNSLAPSIVRRHHVGELTFELTRTVTHGRGQRAEPGHGRVSAAIEAQAERRRGEPRILPRPECGVRIRPASGDDGVLDRGKVGS